MELRNSVLVLCFIPVIHRTYREVRAWFKEIEPEDIGQQILALFLELVTSASPIIVRYDVRGVLPETHIEVCATASIFRSSSRTTDRPKIERSEDFAAVLHVFSRLPQRKSPHSLSGALLGDLNTCRDLDFVTFNAILGIELFKDLEILEQR